MKTIKLCLLITILFCSTYITATNGTTEHAPLKISSDADFAAMGFRGSGTKVDPYRIESLSIKSTGSMSNGIEISNTHAFFVVRGCIIHADYIAINIHDVPTGTARIEANTLKGNQGQGGGISLGADGVWVIGNVCTNFSEGIHTNYAYDCYIVGNTFSNNTYHGISLRYSSHNVVANNTIMSNGAHGIFIIRTSQGNHIYNNTVSGNSAIKSYDWDNIYSFDVNSQAMDEGVGNTWYSEERKVGNHWSDYSGSGVYEIDGSANAADIYPSIIDDATSDTIDMTEPTSTSGQSGITGFPSEAITLGVIICVAYMLKLGKISRDFA